MELQTRLADAKWKPATAKGTEIETAHQVAQPLHGFNWVFGPADTLGTQHRRKHTVARAIAGGTALPHRQIATPCNIKRQVRRNGKRQCVGDRPPFQPQRLRRAGSAGDDGVQHVVKPHTTHHIDFFLFVYHAAPELMVDLVRDEGRGDGGRTSRARRVGRRQHRRNNIAGMPAAARKRIIGVQVTHGHAIGKCDSVGQPALIRAQHASALRNRGTQCDMTRNPAGFGAERPKSASHAVYDAALAVADYTGGQIGKRQRAAKIRNAVGTGLHAIFFSSSMQKTIGHESAQTLTGNPA